jgi:hypothetical protein
LYKEVYCGRSLGSLTTLRFRNLQVMRLIIWRRLPKMIVFLMLDVWWSSVSSMGESWVWNFRVWRRVNFLDMVKDDILLSSSRSNLARKNDLMGSLLTLSRTDFGIFGIWLMMWRRLDRKSERRLLLDRT